MEERIARLEGINEQIRDRLNSIDAHLDGIRHTIDTRFAQTEGRFGQIEARFSQIDNRFMWLTGVVIGTWITTMLTILFHH